MHAAASRSVLVVCHHPHFVAKAYSPPAIPRAATATEGLGGPISAGATFSDIAPSTQLVQLASAIAQQAQRLPDRVPKRPFGTYGGARTAFLGPQTHPHLERGLVPMSCFQSIGEIKTNV